MVTRHESPLRTLRSIEDSPSNPQKQQHYRMTILGAGRVGKTAILKRFLNDEFVEKYRETVEDLHIRTYYVNGQPVQAHIFDTAGNIQFPAMRRLSIGNAQAFLLVYDVAVVESFRMLKDALNEIKDLRPEKELRDIPIVIAGNKCDLPQDDWAVTSLMVDEFMLNETMDCRAVHMETSAKTGYNVRNVFDTFVRISPLFLNQSVTRLPDPAPVALSTTLDFLHGNTLNGQWGLTTAAIKDQVGGGGHQWNRRAQRRFSLQTLSTSHSASWGVGASNYSMASNKAEQGSNPETPEAPKPPPQQHASPARFRPQANSFGSPGGSPFKNGHVIPGSPRRASIAPRASSPTKLPPTSPRHGPPHASPNRRASQVVSEFILGRRSSQERSGELQTQDPPPTQQQPNRRGSLMGTLLGRCGEVPVAPSPDEITELRNKLASATGTRRMKLFKRSKTKSHDEPEVPDCYVQ